MIKSAKASGNNNATVVSGQSSNDNSTVEVQRQQRWRQSCGEGGGNNDDGRVAMEVAVLRLVEQCGCGGGLGGQTNSGVPLVGIDGL